MIESHNLEFKREWKDDFLRVLCAFANTSGGILKLGLNDDGSIFKLGNVKKLLEDLPNKIQSQLGIIANVELDNNYNESNVLSVKINPASIPVSFQGRYYVRSGSVSILLQGKELADFLLGKNGLSWDMMPEERIKKEDFDIETIQKFKILAKDRIPGLQFDENLDLFFEKLNLKTKKAFYRAALLIFGKNPQKYYPQAIVKIGKFINESDIISSDIIRGNLLQQAEQILEVLKTKYLISTFKFEGLNRIELLEYPIEALREAIFNMLIHRDYNTTSNGQIRLYPNALVLLNEGNLPSELGIEDLYKEHLSIPKNPLIADIFYKSGYVEIWGSGTLKIIKHCIANNMPKPVYQQDNGIFKLELFKDVGKDVGKELNPLQLEIIGLLKSKPSITAIEIITKLSVTKRTIERNIRSLRDMNIIERIGGKREGNWLVKSESYN
jgi:ATP-dependent DNA helicase RecG